MESIDNENVEFLKFALKQGVFSHSILVQDKIVGKILSNLKNSIKTEMIFNILTYCDFSRWKQADLRIFINSIKEIIKNDFQKNRILLTANSIMILALAAEALVKIRKSVAVFKRECT